MIAVSSGMGSGSMSALAEFLEPLFETGTVTVNAAPRADDGWDGPSVAILHRAFLLHRLSVAGDPIAFDVGVACAAVNVLRHAVWFLISRAAPPAEVERLVRLEPDAGTASAHLSADLLLRYLPPIHQRARAISPEDPLTVCLEAILRSRPLSGVLSSITEKPSVKPIFDHDGLSLLYAERFRRSPKPLWTPSGRGWEHVERVFRRAGQEPPTVPAEVGPAEQSPVEESS